MAEWKITNPIDYSASGDDIDSFSQKVKTTLEEIFQHLNSLKSNNAAAGLDDADTTPYQLRINTTDNCLYVRSPDNKTWIMLGTLDSYFGATPENINAIRNGGSLSKISLGMDANKPITGNNTYDMYIAADSSTWYCWTGSAWRVLFSLNFKDILNYEKYCISRAEVDYSGKDKILRLDKETGKANVDITGSAERFLDYPIEVQDLQDGDAFVFNAEKKKIVNLPNYIFTDENTTYRGEADKLLKVSSDGKIHVDVVGSINKVDGIEVDSSDIKEGYVLAYKNGKLLPAPKDTFSDENVTTIGEAGKIVKVAEDGTIHANISGNTNKIGETTIDINDLQDGEMLVYHKSTNTFRNEAKNTVGPGKSLILKDGDRTLGDYNGSTSTIIDISKVIENSTVSYINHIMRLVENLYLVLEVSGLNPGGYDGLINQAFNGYISDSDQTSVIVTSIVTGDDSIDVDSINGLIVGSIYLLVDDNNTEQVRIKEVKNEGGTQRVILNDTVKKSFTANKTKLCRSNFDIVDGKIKGDDIVYVTNTRFFNQKKTRAHLTIKHQNVTGYELTAGISLRNSIEEAELFVPMKAKGVFVDMDNPNRASTQFIYIAGDGEPVGNIAAIRISAKKIDDSVEDLNIDSFSVIFNE